jgi:hypothetical protein
VPGTRRSRAHDVLHDLEPFAERPVDDVLTVDVQHVEEGRLERAAGAGAAVRTAPERAHGVLERVGTRVVVDADRLAVEHDRTHRQRAGPADHARQPARDVVQVSGVDPHVVVQPVHLDASAVELPLH